MTTFRSYPQHLRGQGQPSDSQPARSASAPRINFDRFDDDALLALIGDAIGAADARGLQEGLIEALGECLRQLMIEREGRKAAAGKPSLFEALPSVLEAREGAA